MAGGALAAGLALAPLAAAAEVSVREEWVGEYYNQATLTFQAESGESNHLTITYAKQGDGYLRLTVVDEGAVVVAGAGCSGGGSPGVEVHCRMHEPKFHDSEYCGKMCSRPIPGTGWYGSFQVSLGDGTNFFDAHSFEYSFEGLRQNVEMNVEGGSGEDRILTGGGEDRIDPGAGSDEVHSGTGFDRIMATAAPDGPDLYDGGQVIKLSYARRSAPVQLSGSTAGAPGESDTLRGLLHVIGGSGDDVFEGNHQGLVFEGGPGNDVLSGKAASNDLYGGPGEDRLSTAGAPTSSINHLVGEEGNDTYFGGPGVNLIREAEDHADWAGKPEPGPPPASSGDDIAHGGSGRDVIELRAGADVAYGGAGDDSLHGGIDEDALFGGRGGDLLIGGSGFDRLNGGRGMDRIFSGRWSHNSRRNSFPFPPVGDDGPDRVNCGWGRDRAFASPWDDLLACESVRLRK